MSRSLALGPVMADVRGLELDPAEREMLAHPLVGGVILFARNYDTPAQLKALTAAIRSVREPQLLIGVDQEGGRVQRLREGFTRLPAMGTLGRLCARDRGAALKRRAASDRFSPTSSPPTASISASRRCWTSISAVRQSSVSARSRAIPGKSPRSPAS